MNSNEIIPTSEERHEKRAKRSFSWRPSEVGTKGLIPFIKNKDFFYGHFSDRRLVIRYIMAGGTGAFVNITSLYILTDIVGVWYIASAVFAFLISLVVTFFLQKMWAFNDIALHPRTTCRQAALYTASSVSFLGINTLMLYLLVEFFGVWYLLAQFFSLGVVAFGSFMFNKSVTFRKSEISSINGETIRGIHTATQTFFKKHKILIIIFLIALLARSILFFINFHSNDYDLIPTIKGDDGYYELSRGVLLGHGFSWDAEPPFSPNPLRPPVWPLFIATILYLFKSYWMVLFAQIFIGSIIPLLGMHIVNKVIPSIKISITVGLLLALEPYSLLFSSILYTETFFIFLFFIFLLFFLDYFKNHTYRNIILAALFLGLATLTKPTVQYLPVVIPFFMLWHFRKNITKRVFIQIAVFVAIFMLTIAPWLYRNYKGFGVVGISAQPAFNLYVYLVPSVLSIENKTNFAKELQEFLKEDGFDENTITLSNSDYFISQSVAILKQYPLPLLKSAVNSSVAFFTHDGILTVLMYAGHTPSAYLSKPAVFLLFDSPSEFWGIFKKMITSPLVLVLLGRIIWIIITLVAIFGAIRLFIERKLGILGIFTLFLIAYFAATTAVNGLGVNARFRMPVNLFIFMFASYGCLSAINYIKIFITKKRPSESL